MKSRFRALALVGAAAFIVGMASSTSAAATRLPGVSCAVPSLWKAEPRADLSKLPYQQSLFDVSDLSERVAQQIYAAQMHQQESSGLREQMRLLRGAGYQSRDAGAKPSAGGWKVTYKGTGYDRLLGEARERVARGGVLWLVKPKDLGVSQGTAVTALMEAGATIARPAANGMVEFRAPRSSASEIAAEAARALGGSGAASLKQDAVLRTGYLGGGTLRAETAMLRLEGRQAQSPVEFIDNLPTSAMSVYQYGTSFVVHVHPQDLEQLRAYLEDQGNSVVLIGASGPLVEGWGINGAIRACGGTVLADRFPTPMVQEAGVGSANIAVENQVVPVSAGDIMLVVQQPAYGTGLEVALVRFIG